MKPSLTCSCLPAPNSHDVGAHAASLLLLLPPLFTAESAPPCLKLPAVSSSLFTALLTAPVTLLTAPRAPWGLKGNNMKGETAELSWPALEQFGSAQGSYLVGICSQCCVCGVCV